jgi:predicted Zn-dependent protease
MEHLSQGQIDTALTEFTTLIEHNPDYVPAYQMSAQTLAKQGRTEEATTRLEAGLAAAQRTHNAHAASEMQALLDDLIH